MTDVAIFGAGEIVTPNTLHLSQIAPALRAGTHVICEKPLSLDLAECLAVEEEAARHPGLKVMIGLVRRFDASQDALQRAAEFIRRHLQNRDAGRLASLRDLPGFPTSRE